ncbi:hypothetical protein BGX33_012508 [Mortierella sp. NVP41]|nr:hypothetical protein BGX33_012508 [Mortierella sp. NVP41]
MAETVAVAPQLSPRRSPGQQPPRNTASSSLANLQTIAQARAELNGRLTTIHNDLQLTQTIGLLFVKRQEDLKNCFEQLQLLDDQERQAAADQGDAIDAASEGGDDAAGSKPLPETFREQLAALDREFQEGQDGIVGLKGLIDAQLPVTASNSTNDLSTSRSGSVLAPSALPSSTLPAQTISKPRRHKVNMNSAPSTNDAAFPLQIQEELLTQVRYWTTQAELKEKLNQEYDLKINEQERIIDALNKQRRLREESEERQKEDQWNLELQNQELRNQNVDLQGQLSKATHENAKIQKAFVTAAEQVEQLKDKEEKTSSQLELTKSRHEQDMATMRKHMAGIQREKSDLLIKVEDLNATMTLQQRKLAKKATLDAIALAQELEEKAAEPAVEAPVLIQAPARTPSGEEVVVVTPAGALAPAVVEPKVASLARETSFAHQQSIISELQTKLSKEITEKEELITEKEELVKMLADREETIETMRLEGVAVFEPTPLNEKSSLGVLQGHGSRHASDMDHMDDVDGGFDHRDLSMSLSESGSRDFSNGRGSPFPTGGLFAELAQAASTNNIKAAEYKDQEVTTEPIESWIHTIPNISTIVNGVSSSTTESADKAFGEDRKALEAAQKAIEEQKKTIEEDLKAIEAAQKTIEEQQKTIAEDRKACEDDHRAIQAAQKAIEEQEKAMEEKRKAVEEQERAMEEKLKAVEEQEKALEKAQQSIEEDRKTLVEHRKAIEMAQKAIEEQQQAIDVDRKAYEEDRQAIEKAQLVIEEQQKTVEEAQKVIEEKQKVVEEDRKTIETAQQTVEEQQKAIEDDRKGIEAAQKTLEEQRKATEDKQKVIEDKQKVIEEDRKDIDAAQKDLEEQRKAIEDKLKIIEDKQKVIDDKLKVIDEGLKAYEEDRQAIERMQQFIEEQQKAIEGAQKTIEEDRRAIEDEREGFVEDRKAIEAAQKVIEEQQTRIEKAQKAIEEDRRAIEEAQKVMEEQKAIEEHKTEQAKATITGKPGTQTKQIPVDLVPTSLTTETAAVPSDVQYIPSSAAHTEGAKEEVVEPTAGTSVPRATRSSVDDERRHTCDLSQTIAGSSSTVDPPPPVPAVPADLADVPTVKPALKPEDREFRVSFGSAFGGDPSATDTGRIRSVYSDNTNLPVASLEQSQDHAEPASTDAQVKDLAVAAAVVAVTTAAAVNSVSDQKNVSSAVTDESSPTSPAAIAAAARHAESVPVTVQTEQPLTGAGESQPRPSTTVVEVSSHTTYTYAAASTSQVNLPHQNGVVDNITQHHHIITDSTGATIGRHADYRPSPNGSISSMSTDYNHGGYYRNGRRMSNGSTFDVTPTDPTMIQLITQTMIGDYLWKYTRRRMATMMNEKMHWRYVWVHPYTKTMHWSLKNPGSGGPSQLSGKSALILAVTQITDEIPNSDLPTVSLLIQTTSRNIKLKAPTREKHDLWLRSISYLLSRPSSPGADAPGDNQTWSEVQASNPPPRSTATNDTVLTLRQSEMGSGTTLRKKSSLARLQGVFGRNSGSRDGSSSSPMPASSVGSSRIGSSGAHLGVVSNGAAEKRSSVTNLVTAYPIQVNGNGSKQGGNGTVNGGSILAQAESEQQQAAARSEAA